MNTDQLKEYFGTQDAIARALGIKQPTVAEWFAEGGSIPDGRQYQIELATNGELKADKPALRASPDPHPQEPTTEKAGA